MGILDDAIREHLDLKRRHGASDDEVTRKEAEVFGAVQQEVVAVQEPPVEEETTVMHAPPAEEPPVVEAPAQVAAPPPAEPEHAVPDPHDHAHSEGKDPAWGDDAEIFSEAPAPPPVQPQHREERHPGFDTDEHLRGEVHAPEPVFGHQAATPAPPPDVEPAPVEEPPVERPPVEEPPVEGADPADPLEETPEFLQDAPEHDRLWFEQKPPRDFDFGE
jgi:hypothetical protein